MGFANQQPDLCVIGASEAGRAAAMGAAALGLSVILVDRGADRDGLRNPDVILEVLRLEARRRVLDRARGEPIDFITFRTLLSDALRAAGVERRLGRLAAMNIRVIEAAGSFADAQTVVAGDQSIRAWRTFVAVGAAQPAWSGTTGADQCCFTLSDLHRLGELPSKLLVLGGSGDALAAAQGFQRFGSRVVLVAQALLPDIDPELASPVLRRVAQDGVERVEGSIAEIEPKGDGVTVLLRDGTLLAGSHLLDVRDRGSAIDSVDLDRGLIGRNQSRIVLAPSMRTTNRRVYAIGHAGGATSAAAGVAQAGIALRAAFLRLPVRFEPDAVPRVTLTDPQVATIGVSEETATGPVVVWRWPLAETSAGFASGERDGHIKLVGDRGGRILGVGLVGIDVRDLVPFWALAIKQKLTINDLMDVQLPSPSRSEASRRLVLSYAAGRLKSPWLKRVLRVSRRLG